MKFTSLMWNMCLFFFTSQIKKSEVSRLSKKQRKHPSPCPWPRPHPLARKVAVLFCSSSKWISVRLENCWQSFSLSDPNGIGKHFKVSCCNMIFLQWFVSFKAKRLVTWSQNIFFRALQRLVQLVHVMKNVFQSRLAWAILYHPSSFKYSCNLPFSSFTL